MEDRIVIDAVSGRHIPKDLFLISYEDPDLDTWTPFWPDGEFPSVSRHHRLLVLRSFYNHIASRVAYMDTRTVFASPGYKPDRIGWWIRHAKEVRSGSGHYSTILYDLWFADPNYRRLLEKNLDLPVDDSCFETVGSDGSGSSFTKTAFNGRASQMTVLERWRQRPLPAEVLENDEARELNLRIFGWTLNRQGELIS